jgi:hypothetical protein
LVVRGPAIDRIRRDNPELIDDRSDANMGTYKNDHEGPGNNIVFLSFLLAKKVKLHVTVNAQGDVQFHQTFKGFNPSNINRDGDNLSAEEIKFKKIRALGEIFYNGTIITRCDQTEWKRSVHSGITINKDATFTTKESTYFNARGVIPYWSPEGDRVEILIPKGWHTPAPLLEAKDLFRNWGLFHERLWRPLIYLMARNVVMSSSSSDSAANQDPEEIAWRNVFSNAPVIVPERDNVWASL